MKTAAMEISSDPLRTACAKPRKPGRSITEEPKKLRFWRLFLLAAASFAFDQAAKGLVVMRLRPGESQEIVAGFLNIVHLGNQNAALGALSQLGPGPRLFLFFILPVGLMAGMALALRQVKRANRALELGLGLLFGGALGNLFDRLTRGSVVDFIDLHWGAWQSPTFNIADISIGLGILCLLSILRPQPVP
ncbi:MAG TPA: signal peptidase II [bacterium]|nr:signal peptidase II [bacterium]